MTRIKSLAPALALALALLALACSEDDITATPDLALVPDAPHPDASPDRALIPDWEVPDRGVHPDLAVQPLPDLGKLTLVVNVGDSIAAGFAMPGGSAYIDLLMQNNDTAFPAFKGKDLKSKYPGIKLSDKSVGGSTSSQLAAQTAKAATNPTGDTLVIISIGGNDVMFNYMALLDPNEARKMAASVQANITKAVARFSDKKLYGGKVTVLLYTVYEFTDGAGTLPNDAPVDKYCGMLKLLGPIAGKKAMGNIVVYNQEMAKYIKANGLLTGDLYAAFMGHGFNHADKASVHYNAADPTLWFQSDCIHPNKAGHAGIRAEAWRVLFGK
jgi:lysophospholipase L1-like esterase